MSPGDKGKARVLRAVFAVMSNMAVVWAWGGVPPEERGLPNLSLPTREHGERLLRMDSSGGANVTSPAPPPPERRCAVVRGLLVTKVTAVVGALVAISLCASKAGECSGMQTTGAVWCLGLSDVLRPRAGGELARIELSLRFSFGSWNWTENGV